MNPSNPAMAGSGRLIAKYVYSTILQNINLSITKALQKNQQLTVKLGPTVVHDDFTGNFNKLIRTLDNYFKCKVPLPHPPPDLQFKKTDSIISFSLL
jgi:hypothetical protein